MNNNHNARQRGYNQSYQATQNEQSELLLADKVKALKNISINIGDNVREQNALLANMDNDSDLLTSMLNGANLRLGKLTKGKFQCKQWMLIACFVMATFFVMYWILRLR